MKKIFLAALALLLHPEIYAQGTKTVGKTGDTPENFVMWLAGGLGIALVSVAGWAISAVVAQRRLEKQLIEQRESINHQNQEKDISLIRKDFKDVSENIMASTKILISLQKDQEAFQDNQLSLTKSVSKLETDVTKAHVRISELDKKVVVLETLEKTKKG